MVKGKSDPYVKIHIGDIAFKSHVIKENLNPTWNEMYEVGSFVIQILQLLFPLLSFFFEDVHLCLFKQVVLSGRSDQDIKFEAFDKDIDSDDFLGRCVACKVFINY